MRIRFKKWARPELEASKFYIDNPEKYIGKWNGLFENKSPIHLELGCGKGGFISKISVKNPDINYIAIDLVDAMLGLAKRKVEEEYNQNNKEINNIYLTRYDIERIANIFGRDDKIERIYINFCNPWPRGKHHKKRLTHTRQLEKYKQFLKENGEIYSNKIQLTKVKIASDLNAEAINGEIYFKTDDDNLFNDSISYFKSSGFEIIKNTYDLQDEPEFWDNIKTEHEDMFTEQGIKIKALIARVITN